MSVKSSTEPDQADLSEHPFLGGGDETRFLLERCKDSNIADLARVSWAFYRVLTDNYFYANMLKELASCQKGGLKAIERIFDLDPRLLDIEKIKIIWRKIGSYNKKWDEPGSLSLSSIQVKYKRFIRCKAVLDFWENLPGGKEYLQSELMQKLTDYEKTLKLKEWIETTPAVLNLSELNLSDLGLKFIPMEIGLLTNLTRLYLCRNKLFRNKLESVPESLGNLTQLLMLDLSGNWLESVPKSLGNLTNLKKLYLSGNKLESVPENLGNLTNLESLNLSGNPCSSDDLKRKQNCVLFGDELRLWLKELRKE